jgi:hypothetical protein
MTSTIETDLEQLPGRSPSRPWVRALLGVIVLLIAAMWVYAFVFAPRKGVYRVDDAAWRNQAEQICRQAQAQRIALADTEGGYIADPTPAQMLEHADVVDRATDLLEGMLDRIDAVPVGSERDRELVATFLKYYRVIIADRRAYTARLRTFDLAPYRETLAGGGPVTNVVTDFTSGNDIKACVPPGELGGDA